MQGGSRPCLFRCDDGRYYVVKSRSNPQHVRVLANEMFAARVAQSIGLPVAAPAFVEIPDNGELRTNAWMAGLNGVSFAPGWHFGSRYPGDPEETLVTDILSDSLLRRVQNFQEAFWGALLFDKWTCNCDVRQFVFYRPAARKGGSYSACLIDNGFCFNDGAWSFPDGILLNFYSRRWVYEGVQSFHSFEPFLTRIENLSASQLDECLRDIPHEWCGGEPGQLFHLAEVLYTRRRKLRQVIVDAKNSAQRPFPNWT